MKKFCSAIAVILFACVTSYAQVGIGTENPTNTLHVKSASNPLRLEGLQAGTNSDKVVTVDSNGVLKTSPGDNSKFFYAPSWVLPTVNANLPAYTSFDGTKFTVDLYAIYSNQYGLVANSGPNRSVIKSATATTLPVQTAADLEYFVIYFDNTVFDPNSITLSDAGILTYQILPSGVVTEKTFMNIVFKIK